MKDDCVFCKIVAGQIPSRKVHEDADILAFHDIRPIAPVHFMIVPKEHVESLLQCDAKHQALLGKMMLMTAQLAKAQGLEDGYRVIVNTGEGGHQEVFHLHIHVIGGADKAPRMTETIKQL
jgi:histidine triad (HIT) family protein